MSSISLDRSAIYGKPASTPPGGKTVRGIVSLVRAYPWHWLIATMASLTIIGFFIVFYRAGATTAFLDGMARLTMARRVYDNIQGAPSLAQLGSIWLPLMSLLESPLVASDRLFRTGIAGSIVSMISFVAMSVVVFEIARSLSGRLVGGIAATLVLMLNLNVLLFGTNTMSEMLFMALLAASGLCLLRFEQEIAAGNPGTRWIFLASLSFMLMCLIRYDGYFLTMASLPLVALILWNHGVRGHQFIATTGTLFAMPVLAILGWLTYQGVIFGDPLYFARSEYSARSIDVINKDMDGPVGHPLRSAHIYLEAVRWNYSDIVLLLAIGGLIPLVVHALRSRPALTFAIAYFLLEPAFYVVSLMIGQVGIDPSPETPYNIRFGMLAGIPVAIGMGYGIAAMTRIPLRRTGRLLAAAVLVVFVATSLLAWADPIDNTALLADSGTNLQPGSAEIAQWIESNYDHGTMLMDGFGGHKSYVQIHSGLPLGSFLTEATPDLWHAALVHPVSHVDWIYIGSDPDDAVGNALGRSPQLADHYTRVFENEAGSIYLLNERGRHS